MYKNIDKDNMYNSIWDFPDNLIDATGIGDNIILKNSYDNIEKVIVAGMGGSAIGGDVVAILGKEKLKTPFFVVKGNTKQCLTELTEIIDQYVPRNRHRKRQENISATGT